MAFLAFALAGSFSVLLWLISGRYRSRFIGRERVVMNWALDGEPNSYASPRLALAFTPAIGTLSLFLVAGMVVLFTPEGEQGVALLIIGFGGIVLAAVHAAHMHFASRADGG
jgi:hypothetical protein